jgi:nucleoid-associated protein YgaU
MARRKLKSEEERSLVDYADKEPSAFASMLGGLIEANVRSRPEKEKDFASLVARVGIWVTDIDEGVTLDFKGQGGKLTVHNGLKPRRTITIRADAETVMSLSNLKIGQLGLPVYYDEVGRGVATKLLRGKLKVDGLLPNILTLNAVTRIFSVQ